METDTKGQNITTHSYFTCSIMATEEATNTQIQAWMEDAVH
jgi:hypothetical protein